MTRETGSLKHVAWIQVDIHAWRYSMRQMHYGNKLYALFGSALFSVQISVLTNVKIGIHYYPEQHSLIRACLKWVSSEKQRSELESMRADLRGNFGASPKAK